MKITKADLRKIIKEGFSFSGERFGFAGLGFDGKINNYNPYAKYLAEEEEKGEMLDDAWAGGENLANPVDYVKVQTGIETIDEPSILSVNEQQLRSIIRKALLEN